MSGNRGRGPPPLPANVRDIRGSKRARTSAPPDREVNMPTSLPEPPDILNDAEKKVFTDTAKLLVEMRVMNKAVVAGLVMFARNWVEALEAHERVREKGPIVGTKSGNMIVNPYLPVRRKAEDRCLRFMQEYGLTPAAMTRVSKQ